MMRSKTAAAALALLLLAASAAAQCSPRPPVAPVDLGNATGYVILAGAGATSTGSGAAATMITGDLGVGYDQGVTGSPVMVGMSEIHVGQNSSAGFASLTAAYNDAAGRDKCPVDVSFENIGGLTLGPGLYKSTSGLLITGSDLTLAGDASAVFIFQSATSLKITTGMKVILTGGASAANVFWQVGSSATLQANSVFEGTILADQSITSQTGATIHGRALANFASVTMQSARFSLPAETYPADA
ncbi:hypothetical protein FOA52_006134 [Chlamydomonas sp. UWO 241]|nr:hypothetical protein FOA52_006134 [Chlamydomonas sp. UWO 241]